MNSEDTMRRSVMIRAIIAAAFALVLCLPVSTAFAAEDANAGTDGQQVPMSEITAAPIDDTVASNEDESAQLAATPTNETASVQLDESIANTGDSSKQTTMTTASTGEDNLVVASDPSADDWGQRIIDDNTILLTEYIGADKTEIVVPSMIGGRSVVVNRDTFRNNADLKAALTKITFQNGVKIDKNASNMFDGYEALNTVDAAGLDMSACTDMHNMFVNCKLLTTINGAGNWNVSNVTNMQNVFQNCESLTTLDVSNWDVSKVTNMVNLFHDCKKLETLDVSKWNTSSLTTLESVFQECNALTALDVSSWDVSNVTNMVNLFHGCKMLETLNVSNWDMGNVTNMSNMFNGCSSLTSLDTSKWNVGSVTTMKQAFQGCKSLASLDVSSWDVSKVTTFESAFEGMPATTVLDLRNWEATSVNEFAVKADGKIETSGWLRAFRGPLLLVNEGQMKQRLASPNEDGKYIGFDVHGSYGVFLEDSMERVWCLNRGIPTPAGNAYKKFSKHLDEEGLAFLETLVADTKMDKAERWKKIAAALTFFGNVIDSQVQNDLQDTIWFYSDDLIDAKTGKKKAIEGSLKEMIDYVEAHWLDLDYSKAVINFYDSETNPTIPWRYDEDKKEWDFHGKFQNMISLTTAASIIRKDLASIVISKEIATKSNANTDTTFTFTVKLTGTDGKPLTTPFSAASEGEDLHGVTAKDGIITLTTTGEGEACIYNLPVGVSYVITEGSLDGWLLVGTSNTEGTVAEGVTMTATFTNDREDVKTSVTVKKVWDDEGDLDKLRPASIIVTLSNGATVTLSEENGWTATIEDLPKYDADGKPIEYIWTEGNMPEGYTLANVSVDGTVTTLTNAHKHEEKAGGEEASNGGSAGGNAAGGTSAGGTSIRGMAKTGDDALPLWPFAMMALVSLAVAAAARKRQRD